VAAAAAAETDCKEQRALHHVGEVGHVETFWKIKIVPRKQVVAMTKVLIFNKSLHVRYVVYVV
jgi:hypothetical protein